MSDKAGPLPFPSFAALRAAHGALRTQSNAAQSSSAGGDGTDVNAIRSFIAAAQATGAVIGGEHEREDAQCILDDWAAKLITVADVDGRSWVAPRLAKFDPSVSATARTSQADQAALSQNQARSRELIRMSAAARLWRDSGCAKGYLLTGRALTEATAFVEFDQDIAELVRASNEAEAQNAQRYRRRSQFLSLGILVFATVAGVAIVQSRRADYQWRRAEAERTIAIKARKDADLESETANARLSAELAANKIALARFRELQSAQQQLGQVADALRQSVETGKLNRDQLPTAALGLLDARPEARPSSSSPPLLPATGYDTNFLPTKIPLPKLSSAATNDAFESGKPLDNFHYSLVLNAARKIAVFTASNIDRTKLVGLIPARGDLTLDSRVPPDIQASSEWFTGKGISPGLWVSASEIAWVPNVDELGVAASATIAAMVEVYTNVAPQLDDFHRGLASDSERWILTKYNPAAGRMTVFTGPVLRNDDPLVNGVQVPQAFWKILVSTRSAGDSELVVDAFLIPQFSKVANTEFAPKTYRVDVTAVEAATGLDFGPIVREAAGIYPPETALDVPPELAARRVRYVVVLQFAGMTRERAVTASAALKAKSWRIKGEERTAAAAGQNEVRFGPRSDQELAEVLVTDLRAAGMTRVRNAKHHPKIPPGTLEIWISE